MGNIELGTWTDVGLGRDQNEDSVCAIDGVLTISPTFEPMAILGVADGVGGFDSGEVASAFVCQKLGQLLGLRWGNRNIESLKKILNKFTIRLNHDLNALKETDEFGNMATTLVYGLVMMNKAWVVNVGDSRAYLFRGGTLTQITKDHSHVQELLDSEKIGEDEVFGHPESNIVLQAMGQDEIRPDVYEIDLLEGDFLLFCTDGVHDYLRREEIENAIAESINKNTKHLARDLVNEALDSGAEDNVTVVVGRIGD